MRTARILRITVSFFLAVALGMPAQSLASISEWVLVTSPSIGVARNVLSDVDILSRDDAWAVGHSFDETRSADRALVERWDGTKWSIVPTPDSATGYEALAGVAAVGPKDIWAVGYTSDQYGPQRLLIERWNGSRWRVVAAPSFDNWAALEDISVVSGRDAWAVGNSYQGEVVLHWDGRRWSTVPSPNVGWLTAVHAVSSTDVWVVGQRPAPPGDSSGALYGTLVEHWDGRAWSIVPSPSVNADFNILESVHGRSGDLWAVGSSWESTQPQTPLILQWDGGTWRIVPSADPTLPDARLSDVAFVSSTEVLAVGSAAGRTLAQRWNGASWTTVPSPSPGNTDELLGISATPLGVWAVGTSTNESGSRTLALRRS